jgi:hypothetical protein
MQLQQMHGIVPRTSAYGDGGLEVIQPDSRVLLPIEIGYAITDFQSLG